MKALTAALVVLATSFTTLTVDAAAAAAPMTIAIEATRLGPAGTFDVSGAVADEGTFEVSDPVFGGPGPGRFVNVHATETFSGAAGTFTLTRKIRVTWGDDPHRTISGNWVVTSGTGAYLHLHAQGTISGTVQGTPPAETFVLIYSGAAVTG